MNYKQFKIEGEKEDLEKLNNLLKQLQLYRKELKSFLEILQRNGADAPFENNFSQRMNQSIFPLVKEYQSDSLSEIVQSELITQELTRENIKIIRNYLGVTFVISLLLFIYIYHSIYIPIKQLKIATCHLGLNFLRAEPIPPKNPDDELGDLTKCFNETILKLKEEMISKSYLDNIINSISQSLIVLDLENNIEKINYNTQELLGYSEPELVGKSLNYIWGSTNALSLDKLLETDDYYDNYFSIELITKSCQKKYVRVYFSPLFESFDETKGTICLAMELKNLH